MRLSSSSLALPCSCASALGRLPPCNNTWDSVILVPVKDVWAAHALPAWLAFRRPIAEGLSA
jgi:hypothetical protein